MSWEGFDVSETTFRANLWTSAKHPAFSTNHLARTNMLNIAATKKTQKPKTLYKKTTDICKTKVNENSLRFRGFNATQPVDASDLLYNSWRLHRIWDHDSFT